MEMPRPSVSTRTREFTPRELSLVEILEPPRPPHTAVNRKSERIREALRRWFEEEL